METGILINGSVQFSLKDFHTGDFPCRNLPGASKEVFTSKPCLKKLNEITKF